MSSLCRHHCCLIPDRFRHPKDKPHARSQSLRISDTHRLHVFHCELSLCLLFFFFYLSNSLGLYILCWGMSPNVCRPLAMSSYLRRIRHQNADWKFRVHNLPRQLVGFTTELIFLLSFLKENPTISCLESINMAANFTEQSGYVL